jgi:hypothetical protein
MATGGPAARPGAPGPDTLTISRQITRLVLHVYALRMAAVFTISTATITLRTKVIPQGVGVAGFAIAAALPGRANAPLRASAGGRTMDIRCA